MANVRVLTLGVLLGTFLAGIVAGIGILRWLVPPMPFPPPPPPHGPVEGPFGGPFAELGLDPEQAKQVFEIQERHRPEIEAIIESSRPQVRKIQDAVEKEIDAVLTPAQREKLAAMKAHPPPGPPPGMGPPGMGPPGGPPPGMPPGMPPPGLGPPGGPPGPPPREMIEACAKKATGEACQFKLDGRAISGRCTPPPPNAPAGAPLACAPEGPPPRGP